MAQEFEYTELTNCKVGDKIAVVKMPIGDIYGTLCTIVSFTDLAFIRERVDNGERSIDFKHHFPKVYRLIKR